jgi:L,D-peptidoglycan transpeptidase YkuD (ErfK/YbiS/YcfS/YnhG family)
MVGRNGRNGWKPAPPSSRHSQGDIKKHPKRADRTYKSLDDLTSPIGVFTLTDAGGRLPNPGTALPWVTSRVIFNQTGERQPFDAAGNQVDYANGVPLDDTFNYAVGVNYNRARLHPKVPARLGSRNYRKPLGKQAGGGVLLHVAYGAPTHGCLVVEQRAMVEILRWLDPKHHPVIIMGDKRSLRH